MRGVCGVLAYSPSTNLGLVKGSTDFRYGQGLNSVVPNATDAASQNAIIFSTPSQ
jgi:hypothetical protein